MIASFGKHTSISIVHLKEIHDVISHQFPGRKSHIEEKRSWLLHFHNKLKKRAIRGDMVTLQTIILYVENRPKSHSFKGDAPPPPHPPTHPLSAQSLLICPVWNLAHSEFFRIAF
jgi:hypothetical protein